MKLITNSNASAPTISTMAGKRAFSILGNFEAANESLLRALLWQSKECVRSLATRGSFEHSSLLRLCGVFVDEIFPYFIYNNYK